jgi:hypothetical protein
MNFIKKLLPITLLLLVLAYYPLPAQNNAITINMDDGAAVVTLLDGRASFSKEGMKKPKALATGDRLTGGDRVTTEIKSRIELKLPDNSIVRFDEKTTFMLTSLAYDQKTQKKDIDVNMILGKTWANVPKFSGSKGRFAITTKTSVAGVRGTDFRMNVNQDNSAVLKVYEGEVAVSKRKDAGMAETAAKREKPTQLADPHPVPGPHPVSMETWTYLVGALQQINILPDGSAAKPFRFDIEKDLNEWVRWNQSRNQLIQQQGK